MLIRNGVCFILHVRAHSCVGNPWSTKVPTATCITTISDKLPKFEDAAFVSGKIGREALQRGVFFPWFKTVVGEEKRYMKVIQNRVDCCPHSALLKRSAR